MTKLNQIIAIANGKKTAATAAVTNIYHTLQKEDLFKGFERKYQPLDDEGEKLPVESKLVQQTVTGSINQVKTELNDLFDVIATQENANCQAKADIVVDGVTLAKDVPVTTMLFLEKQLDNLKSIVAKIPTLAPDVKWRKSESDSDLYVADTVVTNRTKKVPRAFIKAEATDKHPAQVDVFTEDVIVGTWNKTDLSSAIPSTKKEEIAKRVDKLRDAVKMAREEANSVVVNDVKVGKSLTDFIFGA